MPPFFNNLSLVKCCNHQYHFLLDEKLLNKANNLAMIEFPASDELFSNQTYQIHLTCQNINTKTLWLKIIKPTNLQLDFNLILLPKTQINCIIESHTTSASNYKLNFNNQCQDDTKLNLTILQLEQGKTNFTVSNTLFNNSKVQVNSLVLAKNQSNVNLQINNIAQNDNSQAKINSRNVLWANSVIHFDGHPIVKLGAKNCESLLEQKNLLIDPQARLITTPRLSIANNEVKASHSATISTFSKEDLFYLKTRGLNETEAIKLLLEAFITEIIETISDDQIKGKVHFSVLSK